MKKYIHLIPTVVVALGLALTLCNLTGCKTVTKPDGSTQKVLDVQKTCEAIRVIVPPAVALAISKDPNAKPYLQTVSIVLKAAVTSGQYDPKLVEGALAKISIKELRTSEAAVAVNAMMGIYRVYWGDAVTAKLNTVIWLSPVLTAIADSIDAGMPLPVDEGTGMPMEVLPPPE